MTGMLRTCYERDSLHVALPTCNRPGSLSVSTSGPTSLDMPSMGVQRPSAMPVHASDTRPADQRGRLRHRRPGIGIGRRWRVPDGHHRCHTSAAIFPVDRVVRSREAWDRRWGARPAQRHRWVIGFNRRRDRTRSVVRTSGLTAATERLLRQRGPCIRSATSINSLAHGGLRRRRIARQQGTGTLSLAGGRSITPGGSSTGFMAGMRHMF